MRTGIATCLALLIMSSTIDAQDQTSGIVVNGRIWTGNSDRPWAESLAIRGERIIAIGSRSEIAALVPKPEQTIDAGNGLVVPGMCDSHIHLIAGGMHLASVQLRDASSREEFVKRIADFVKNKPANLQWVTGGDWDHTLWGGELPDRNWIDQVTGDTPVWLSRLDGHMALANSAAIRAAVISDDVEAGEGGEIVRDAAGRMTGIFKDNAMELIARAQPPASIETRLSAATMAMKYLAAQGITAVHHMGSWDDVDVFRLARQRGLLATRVYAFTPLADWQRLAEETAARGRGDRWLQLGGLKGFVDGSLGSHTAAFLEPYSDDPSSRGLLVNSEDELESWTRGADNAGLQVAVHAIGDRAIRLQLDVFERVSHQNGPRDRRFRIEHAQHIAPSDIPRFGELRVIASMQPYHAIDDGRWADGVIGSERSATTYAFRSLLDTRGRLAFGSDWYVAPATPLEGIDAAVTRRTLDGKHPNGWVPEQKISAEEALRAYTSGAAYAGFAEQDLGTLEAGKLADLVIIDRDFLSPDEHEIGKAQVMLTMVDGKVVFRRE